MPFDPANAVPVSDSPEPSARGSNFDPSAAVPYGRYSEAAITKWRDKKNVDTMSVPHGAFLSLVP